MTQARSSYPPNKRLCGMLSLTEGAINRMQSKTLRLSQYIHWLDRKSCCLRQVDVIFTRGFIRNDPGVKYFFQMQ